MTEAGDALLDSYSEEPMLHVYQVNLTDPVQKNIPGCQVKSKEVIWSTALQIQVTWPRFVRNQVTWSIFENSTR